MVNLIFNQIQGPGVAQSMQSADSVSREMIFYYGSFSGLRIQNIPLCVIDTIGLCDSKMTDEEVINLVRNKVEGLSCGINHVILAFHGRLERPQAEAVQALLRWIDLRPSACSLFVTKTDGLSKIVKEECAASWNGSPIISALREERFGLDSNSGEEVRINNFHLIAMPNPSELEEEDQPRAYERSVKARSEILMRFFGVQEKE